MDQMIDTHALPYPSYVKENSNVTTILSATSTSRSPPSFSERSANALTDAEWHSSRSYYSPLVEAVTVGIVTSEWKV